MSFLTSRALTRATPFLGRRTFGTSPVARKSATEAVKDTVKGVDRTISDVAVKGIDKGGKLHCPCSSYYIPESNYPSPTSSFFNGITQLIIFI